MVEVGGDPGDRRVAVVADVAAQDMARVLARGGHAVVATATGADDLGVIDHGHGNPARTRVTVLADIGRVDVRRVLPRGVDAVVAARAVITSYSIHYTKLYD